MADKLLIGRDQGGEGGTTRPNYFILGKFICLFSGTLKYIYIYVGAATKAKVAIYSDNSGSPNALLSSGGEITCASGWNAVPITNVAITKNQYYWLAFIYNTSVMYFYGMSGSGVQKFKYVSYSGFSFPNPAGNDFTDFDRQLVIYGFGSDVIGGFGLVGDGLVFSEEGGGLIIG